MIANHDNDENYQVDDGDDNGDGDGDGSFNLFDPTCELSVIKIPLHKRE